MNTICIMCPLGCELSIYEQDGEVRVTGNTCKRGEKYGVDEYTAPKRTVTTLANMKNGEVASVKTSVPIPKERIFDVINAVAKLKLDERVKIGDVVVKDILGLGADIVVTGRK